LRSRPPRCGRAASARRSSRRRAGAVSRRSCWPPTRPCAAARGSLLGGRTLVGESTVSETIRYVVDRARCRVILTAPARDRGPRRAGRSAPISSIRRDVRVDSRSGTRRVRCRQAGPRAGSRGLGARRGPPLARAPRRDRGADLGGRRRRFTVGTALEVDALIEAGVQRADVFIASTDGDNTNLTVAQIVSGASASRRSSAA
jgi:hypothetical protein